MDDLRVPPGLYDHIYANAPGLPGYSRYWFYQEEILSQKDPLEWLARQEPAYWFIQQHLRNIGSGARILEIGSGLGYLAFAIKHAGYNIVGTDISREAVDRARSRFGNIYDQADLFDLPGRAERYDLVILTEVIEHVPQPVDFLRAASAVTTDKGAVLITTPNKSASPLNTVWGTESPPVHLWWLSETSVRQIARQLRLSVKFGDFAAMYAGLSRPTEIASVTGAPPALGVDGKVTPEAQEWVRNYNRSEPWKRRLRVGAPGAFRTLFRLQQARRAFGRFATERTWQLGAVLERPHLR